MITALLCLLESKQDNGCFLQKMKQSFDSWFQLDMMRGTHHSQPIPQRPTICHRHTAVQSLSFSTLYQHFFLHLSPFLLLFPLFVSVKSSFQAFSFLYLSFKQMHTHIHIFPTESGCRAALSAHIQYTFAMSNKLFARKRGKSKWLFALGVNSTGHTAWLFAPQ